MGITLHVEVNVTITAKPTALHFIGNIHHLLFIDHRLDQHTLKNKIPVGKKAITDGSYPDKKDPKLMQPNSHDPEQLCTVKASARMCQEAFHSHLKQFHCLTDIFRQGQELYGTCFVAVIWANEMEMWSMHR